MNFLNYFHCKTIKYDLINKFNYNKTKNLPKLKKVILNFSFNNTQIKNLSASLLALELIAIKKGKLTTTKKSNILLKIRKGNPVGCKVVLQNDLMFTFLERLIVDIIPSNPITKKSRVNVMKNNKSFSLKILNNFNFKELEKNYNLFNELNNLNIIFVFESNLQKELIFVLNSLKLIN